VLSGLRPAPDSAVKLQEFVKLPVTTNRFITKKVRKSATISNYQNSSLFWLIMHQMQREGSKIELFIGNTGTEHEN
jgi:hypothetical protein